MRILPKVAVIPHTAQSHRQLMEFQFADCISFNSPSDTQNVSELAISGRGSMYTVILGEYSSGSYLCIPEQGIGCPLGSLSDTFWNFEQLSRLICRTDAATIVNALEDYGKYRDHS